MGNRLRNLRASLNLSFAKKKHAVVRNKKFSKRRRDDFIKGIAAVYDSIEVQNQTGAEYYNCWPAVRYQLGVDEGEEGDLEDINDEEQKIT